MNSSQWITGKVIVGLHIGTTINYPTINLSPRLLHGHDYSYGVYSSLIKINNNIFSGALFYGPKTINRKRIIVLEIHIFDFNQTIYNHHIKFKIQSFIRPPIIFNNVNELKQQIKRDIEKIKSLNQDTSLD